MHGLIILFFTCIIIICLLNTTNRKELYVPFMEMTGGDDNDSLFSIKYDALPNEPPDDTKIITVPVPAVIPKVDWLAQQLRPAQDDPLNPIPPDQSPAEQWVQLVQKYGMPDIFDPTSEGVGIWKNETLVARGFCWERITIEDYSNNFLNFKLFFPLPTPRGDATTEDLTNAIYTLHPSLGYDVIKQLLQISVNRIDDALALLVPTIRFILNKISSDEAQQLMYRMLDIVNPYSLKYDPNASKQYEIEICFSAKDNDDPEKKKGPAV